MAGKPDIDRWSTLESLSVLLVPRRLGVEFVGTALLLIAVVGSGIAAQRLSPNDIGLELLEKSIATGAAHWPQSSSRIEYGPGVRYRL